jgi:hypothetical protein
MVPLEALGAKTVNFHAVWNCMELRETAWNYMKLHEKT